MNKKSPIEIFSEWVDNGKDDGMELNHCDSVNAMLNQVLNNANNYSFIDWSAFIFCLVCVIS